MSTLTQRIPHLLGGISQQPDNRKFPGQVRDCVNAFPDYALGLLKRPGGQFQSKLIKGTSSGLWFPILRDENEKYVCQIDTATGNIRIWDLSTGQFKYSTNFSSPGNPAGCVGYETQLNTLNTQIEDTADALAALHTAQSNYAKILAGQEPTEVALFEVQYDYDNPGEIEQTIKSGILKTSAGVYIVKENDAIISSTTTLPANYALGNERTDEYPLIASQGFRVYQAIKTIAAVNTPAELVAAETAMNNAQTAYENAVSDQASDQAVFDSALALCSYTTGFPSGHYLQNATPDDIKVLTVNDYTFIVNTQKVPAYTVDESEDIVAEGFFLLKVVGTGHYRISIDGVEVATYNAGAGSDADTILNDLTADINAYTSGGTTPYNATRIGSGIYITADDNIPFKLEAIGGPGDQSVFAFTSSVPSVASLPLQCAGGYKVKVVNTQDVTADDFYVIFEGDDGDGTGTWVETNGFGIPYKIDKATMPHVLIRLPGGSFIFTAINGFTYPNVPPTPNTQIPAWGERTVGDEETNPDPSFIGSTIKNVFFHRNRLGFLTEENVVLSKAGDFFNFFATTALTVGDDDPIDISASTTKPVKLRYVKPSSVGLTLFSDKEQFILNTDSDILSPKTAKINALSSYECDANVSAVELGTSLAFISKTPLYTRLFEIGSISTTNPPTMVEPTQYVPELVPSSINSFISSPSLSLMSLGTTGTSTLYQLRYAQQGEERSATTWYKWELTGTLLTQFFDVSTYYAVVANGANEIYIQSYDLTQASEQGFLKLPSGERTDVCLDLWHVNPYRTYNSLTDKTRLYLPYNEVNSGTFAVVALGGYIGDPLAVTSASVGAVLYPTVASSSGTYYVEIDGNYLGRNLIIGYIYDMEVELPKFYVTQSDGKTASSDFTSDLIIHRLKLSAGLSGPIKYQINITGRSEWNQTVEAVQPNVYALNNVNLTAESVQNISVYQRNDNLAIKIIGDTPMPVTILSLTWEGRYNTGFYRRS